MYSDIITLTSVLILCPFPINPRIENKPNSPPLHKGLAFSTLDFLVSHQQLSPYNCDAGNFPPKCVYYFAFLHADLQGLPNHPVWTRSLKCSIIVFVICIAFILSASWAVWLLTPNPRITERDNRPVRKWPPPPPLLTETRAGKVMLVVRRKPKRRRCLACPGPV